MLGIALLCCGLLAAGPDDEGDVVPTYESARSQAGRDPEAHVRLALWCEQHGMSAERLRHLSLALIADPGHAKARALLGLVDDDGKWRRPEAVAERVKSDAALAATLAEYNAKRSRAAETADAQWRLALWCEENGLKPEATAHFTAVTRLDPKREAAWKRLGFKKHDGRWMTAEQIDRAKVDRREQAEADKHWLPMLEQYREGLRSQDPSKRSEAAAVLTRVTDPRAVPSLWKVFALGDAAHQARAVQLLGQIDARAASRSLAALAVFGHSEEVRRAATETLRRRDPREFADALVDLVRDPLKYEVRPIGGPGQPGALFVEGQRYNLLRTYQTPLAPPVNRRIFSDAVSFDPFEGRDYGVPQWQMAFTTMDMVARQDFARRTGAQFPSAVRGSAQLGGLPAGTGVRNGRIDLTDAAIRRDQQIALNEIEYRRATAEVQQRLTEDIAAIEAENESIRDLTARVATTLRAVSGLELGDERQAWRDWWVDQLGYSYTAPPAPKPTFAQNVPARLPGYVRNATGSCFAAGTPVVTLTGLRPIETLGAGDRVLTQKTDTGALSYQPIVAVQHNPPAKTLKVTLGGETIVSSTFHRFWKAGAGWKMARELEVGDPIRTLDGVVKVEAIDEEEVQPVYNLDVAGNHDFFVGRAGALVHDNTVPGLRLEPFDAAPTLKP